MSIIAFSLYKDGAHIYNCSTTYQIALTTQSDLFAAVPTRFTVNTDGGCRANGSPRAIGGWGVYIVNHQTGEETDLFDGEGPGPTVTNNRMELMAVIQGLRAVPANGELIVVTDSQYVQKGISEWIHGWKKKGWKTAAGKPVQNQDLWLELDALVLGRKNLKFEWVRGHAGHPGNERADALSNQAMDAVAARKGK